MINILLGLLALRSVAVVAQCPPLGSTLPVASNYQAYALVKETVEGIGESLREQTRFENTAFALTMGTVNSDIPLLEFHNAPTAYNTTGSHVLTTDTQFIVASISKLFTAYGIRLLADSGKINLGAAVTTFVPELLKLSKQAVPKDATSVTDWQQITVDALMSHLGDIAEDLGDSDIDNAPGNYSAFGLPHLNRTEQGTRCGDSVNPYQRPCTEMDFFANWGKKNPVYAPFTTPVYSNIGYAILGLAIERVSGVPFAQYMQEAIIQPLGLMHTSVDHPISLSDAFITQKTADGDLSEGFLASAGAIYSSSSDLYALGRSILSSTLLSPAATRAWLKPRTFTSSAGTFVGEVWEIGRGLNLTGGDGHIVDVYTKGGNLDLYSSLIAVVPDYGFVLALTSAGPNTSGAALEAILSQILSALVPAFEAANKVQAKQVYVGTYTAGANRITLAVDQGPGLLVANFSVNGVGDVVSRVGELMGAEPGKTTLRLYPTNLIAGNQMAWQGVYDTLSAAEATAQDALLFFQQGTCQSWSEISLLSYGLVPLDSFIFTVNDDGRNVAVDARAWRTIMERT